MSEGRFQAHLPVRRMLCGPLAYVARVPRGCCAPSTAGAMSTSDSSKTQTPCKKRKADAFTEMLDDKLDDALLKDSVREIVSELLAKPAKILYTLTKVRTDDLIPKPKVCTATAGLGKAEPDFSKEYKTYGLVPKDTYSLNQFRLILGRVCAMSAVFSMCLQRACMFGNTVAY